MYLKILGILVLKKMTIGLYFKEILKAKNYIFFEYMYLIRCFVKINHYIFIYEMSPIKN